MKKYLKFIFVFMTLFICFENISAETLYNYSCDYSFAAPGSGEEIKFRIRIYELSDEIIKNPEIIGGNDKNTWKEHVKNMYYTVKGDNKEYDISDDETIEDFYNKNKEGCNKLTLLDNSVGKRIFIQRSVSNNSIVCPKLYMTNSCQVSFYDTTTEIEPNSGAIISEEKNIPVTNKSMNCYKSASDTNPTICTNPSPNNSELYNEDNKECVYYANNRSTKFKFIYDKNNKTLQFDDMNKGFTVDSSIPQENKSGKIYITDGTLLSKFAEGDNCPYSISCDCSTSLLTGKGKTCSFSDDKPRKNCGILVSNNGEKTDETGKEPGSINTPNLNISTDSMTCKEILGPNLTKLVNALVTALRIVGAIIAIVNGMISLVPAIVSKNQDALKKAAIKCVYMAVILALIILLPMIIKFIGNIFDFDISCFVE